MPIVRSPCTFECPRTQTVPAPGRPMSAGEQEVYDHRHVVDAIALLGDAKAPRNNSFLRAGVHRGGSSNLASRQPALFDYFVPVGSLHMSAINSSKPSVKDWINGRSIAEGCPSALRSKRSFKMPLIAATSPFTRTGR